MKYPSMMPKQSRAVFTPLTLSCAQPGTYSIGFKSATVSKIVANKVRTEAPDEELIINSPQKFECLISQVSQTVEIYMLDDQGMILTGGLVPLFDEFAALEPTTDAKSAFEPQQLK